MNDLDKADVYAHDNLLDEAETLKPLVKTRYLPTRVNKLRSTACPGWMSQGINIELQSVTLFPPSRPRLVFGSLSHHDGYFVIIWMNIFFHATRPNDFRPV